MVAAWIAVAAAGAAVVGVVTVLAWRVPAAHEALVVTGRRPRVLRSGGALVVPGLARAARVDLAVHPFEVVVDARCAEGVAVTATVSGAWRVGPGDDGVDRAARHLPGGTPAAARHVTETVAGRVRAAIGAEPGRRLAEGGITARLAGAAREGAARELATLGLEPVRLEVAALGDPTGYLADLVRPVLARAAADRRIAEADASVPTLRQVR